MPDIILIMRSDVRQFTFFLQISIVIVERISHPRGKLNQSSQTIVLEVDMMYAGNQSRFDGGLGREARRLKVVAII